jgi:2-methylcitrate dehydratase
MKERQADTRDPVPSRTRALGRRDLMKIGAGVLAAAAGAPSAAAQGRGAQNPNQPVPAPGSTRKPGAPRPHTGPGYKYTANRLGNNGPMDDTSRKVVAFVSEFNDSKLTDATVHAINRTMIDSMAALVAGFEEEPVRIAVRMTRHAQPVGLKSTVMGYGLSATPELATFANCCLIRMTDFNDNGDGGHDSDLIPAALAIGEALHSTGAEVMAAIAIGYEVKAAPAGGESVAAAMAAGKLMKLDEDRLANALTIALTPHVALNKGVGAMSMWKGVRSAEAMKCGVWAALLAREGMTGPPQPFEGRGGLWSRNGRGREFTMPVRPAQMAIERNWFKRRPAEASSQGTLLLIPEMRSWTKVDEIGSIFYEMNDLGEISDNPKWDPRNRETADHSMPYILARALIDGDIYLDSFTPAKYMDPVARSLMDKMTFGQVEGWRGLGPARITIRKKSGEERSWDTYNGARALGEAEYPRVSDEETAAKFNRACAYHKMDNAQRDRARAIWGNLRAVKDIGDAIHTLATFGQPKPL